MRSLRQRLAIIILVPLVLLAMVAATLRWFEARATAEDLYDRTLLAVTHVIARDVVLTDGDLLAEEVIETLTDELVDQIFYHVVSEEGALPTGYNNPPPLPADAVLTPGEPLFYSATFRGQPVRVVALRTFLGDRGWVQLEVWQTVRERRRLTLALAGRAALLMTTIILAAGLIVWFGVRLGLAPLASLREAIGRRSPDDLSPIRRPVPEEVQALVGATNSLLARLSAAFAEREAILSDAAHQLRNPIAGIQSQAEAALKARDADELRRRTADVAEAARRTGRLTRQLLSIEKARGRGETLRLPFDLADLAREVVARFAPRALRRGVDVSLDGAGAALEVRGDATMVGEAIENLLDNALAYGAAGGGEIRVTLGRRGGLAVLTVADDGPGVPDALAPRIFDRFVRGEEGGPDGCGLGLAIVRDVARAHGGDVMLAPSPRGAAFDFTLAAAAPTAPTAPGPAASGAAAGPMTGSEPTAT